MQCYDAMGGAASPDCPDSKAENKLGPDNFLSAVKYNLWKIFKTETHSWFVWIIDKTSGVMQGCLEHLWQNEGQNTE